MSPITRTQAHEIFRNSGGVFLSCDFIKADGSERTMHCRWATIEEVAEHREREGCVTVYEGRKNDPPAKKKGWRTIRLDRLKSLTIGGVILEVCDD